jgi:hypothetical protein
MKMDMPSATSSGTRTHFMPSMGPQASMSAHDMSGMASTFSSSTRVTLWFTEWTTTTTATYVLTIFFLFFLGIFNRFLSALKSQLERKWNMHEAESAPHSMPNTEKLVDHSVRGHARQWSRALRQQPLELDDKDREEIEPLSPVPPKPLAAEEIGITRNTTASRKRFWVAQAPWSLNKDGVSAALEFTRALIGYVLYVLDKTYKNHESNSMVECLPS